MLPIRYPLAGDADPFARVDLGGMAYHRHQITVAAGLDPQPTEAYGGAVNGAPLDQPSQHPTTGLRRGGSATGISRSGHQRARRSRGYRCSTCLELGAWRELALMGAAACYLEEGLRGWAQSPGAITGMSKN